MGREAVCTARHAGRAAEGKALLETDEVVFRSPELKLKVPFAGTRVAVEGDALVLRWSGKEAVLDLGAKEAAAWAERIANPKGLLDKLGVKAGQKVSVVGLKDASFIADLAAKGADVSTRVRKDSDLVFYAVDDVADLARLPDLEAAIVRDGAVWVLHPKGRKDLQDVHVFAAAKRAGLVDNKVCRFNETLSALRLCVPRARR